MQIEFQITHRDYTLFLKRLYFKKYLIKQLIWIIIISLFLGNPMGYGKPFELWSLILNSLIVAIVLLSVLILIPFLISKFRTRKYLKTRPLTEQKTIALHEDGINVPTTDGNLFWKWESLKSADIVTGFVYVTLFNNKYYFIPLCSFASENEAVNFLGVLKNGILKVRGKSMERKVRNLYYWGLVGFIPNFGAIAGIILIAKGIEYKNKNLILIGIADILFTVLFWTVIFPLIVPK